MEFIVFKTEGITSIIAMPYADIAVSRKLMVGIY